MIYKHFRGIQLLRYVASLLQLTDLRQLLTAMMYFRKIYCLQLKADFQRVCWELLLMDVCVLFHTYGRILL